MKDLEFQKEVVSNALFELEEGKDGRACVKVKINNIFFKHSLYSAPESETYTSPNTVMMTMAANIHEAKIFRHNSMVTKSLFPQATLQDKPRVFSQTQIVSMLLSNLKKIAVMDHGSEVEDCVIGVPVDWTEEQRKILMDGADLAGLKCLSLLNENTATALVCILYVYVYVDTLYVCICVCRFYMYICISILYMYMCMSILYVYVYVDSLYVDVHVNTLHVYIRIFVGVPLAPHLDMS
jgi:hypothetical protein